MKDINLTVKGQTITSDVKSLVSDTRHIYECHYDFDESWDGFQKWAVFKQSGKPYRVLLVNDECEMPVEAVQENGYAYIGVCGFKDNKRYPTIWSMPIAVQIGVTDGFMPPIPTPSEWEQIITRLNDIEVDVENKVDKEDGKGLSTNDFTNNLKNKLDNLENYDDTQVRELISNSFEAIEQLDISKQDNINDLETIRSGASKGASSIQPNDNISKLNNDTGYITSAALNNYSLISQTGSRIDLEIDNTNYKLVAKLYDKNGNLISTSSVIDFPIEQLIVTVSFDSDTNELIITLKNGTTTRVPIGAIISGLATQTYVTNAISVEDTNLKNWANGRFLTEHQSLSNYYTKSETNTQINNHHDTTKQDNLTNGNYVYVDSNRVLQLDTKNLMRVEVVSNQNITMVQVKSILDVINQNHEHVVFDVSSLGQSMYLASILIDGDLVIIEDWLDSDNKYVGEYDGTLLLKDLINTIGKAIYGVKRDMSSSSPTWTRTHKAVNLVANATKDGSAVVNDFDDIYPWSAIKTINMASNGTINAEIGDDNFKFDGTNGDVMTYIPEFWFRRYQAEGYEYIDIASVELAGFTKSEAFYVGRYHTSSGAVSNGGFPQVSTNITNFRTQAQAKGSKWQQLDYHYFIIQLLYLVEYASYHSQDKLGNGVSSIRYVTTDVSLLAETSTNRIIIATDNSAYEIGTAIDIGTSQGNRSVAQDRIILSKAPYDDGTITGTAITFDGSPVNIAVGNVLWGGVQKEGQCDTLGMLSGTLNNNGRHSCIYRGIENPFGNCYQFVDGLNIKDNVAYINYNPSTYLVDKFDGDYKEVGYTNANANGYGKTLGYDSEHPLVALDTEIGGSTSTYLCDYYYQNSGNRIAFVGGGFRYGSYAGLWSWYLDLGSTYTSINVGSRLLKTV